MIEELGLGLAEEERLDVSAVGEHHGGCAAADFEALGAGVGAIGTDAEAGGALADEAEGDADSGGSTEDAGGIADEDGMAFFKFVLHPMDVAVEHFADPVGSEVKDVAGGGELLEYIFNSGFGGSIEQAGVKIQAHAGEAKGDAAGALGGVREAGDGEVFGDQTANQAQRPWQRLVLFV